MNLDDLKETYRHQSNNKLIGLYKERENLNPLALPVLIDELKRRRLFKALLQEEENRNPGYNFTPDELKEFVKGRLQEGESIESIRIDLENNGIYIKRQLLENMHFEQGVMDEMLHRELEGENRREVEEDVSGKYGLGKEDIERIKSNQKPTGKLYLILGIVMIVGAALSLSLFITESPDSNGSVKMLVEFLSLSFGAYKSIKKYDTLNS